MDRLPLALCFLWSWSAHAAPAIGPREELKKLTAQLQASPSDQALRERIIALAAKLKPAPALPEEAERRMARGKAGFKTAEKSEDYKAASEEFLKAVLAAPWWADAYFNLGQAQEKAGELAGARASLALYLKAAPNAADAKAVREKVYELEFMEEKKKAKLANLAGRWAEESGKVQGKHMIEIYREVSGKHSAVVPETGGVSTGGVAWTKTLLNFEVPYERSVNFAIEYRMGSGKYPGWMHSDYRLTLSDDGVLRGTQRYQSNFGGGEDKTHDVALYRLE